MQPVSTTGLPIQNDDESEGLVVRRMEDICIRGQKPLDVTEYVSAASSISWLYPEINLHSLLFRRCKW